MAKNIYSRKGYTINFAATGQTNTQIQQPGNKNFLLGILAANNDVSKSDNQTLFSLKVNSELIIELDNVKNYYAQNITNQLGYIPINRILSGNDDIAIVSQGILSNSYQFTFIYGEMTADFIREAR